MSAVESSQSDSRTSPAQKRRVSIANWFFAATITGLWTLVAGPGVVTETMATSRAGSRIYESGWPAVHCVFLETSMDPGMIGSPGQKMLEKFVDGARSEFLKKKFGFKWAEAGHQNHKSQVGLWSNSSNWQYFRNDPKKILWSGLAVNLLILLLMVATVVVFVEYRIRSRGLLFRFSMAELLVLFTCFGLGLWQIGMMLSASARDHLAASQIQRFDQTHLDWRNNLPIVLLRLLDNRSSFVIPWTDKVLTVDRVDRVSVTNVGDVIPSESAKKHSWNLFTLLVPQNH